MYFPCARHTYVIFIESSLGKDGQKSENMASLLIMLNYFFVCYVIHLYLVISIIKNM